MVPLLLPLYYLIIIGLSIFFVKIIPAEKQIEAGKIYGYIEDQAHKSKYGNITLEYMEYLAEQAAAVGTTVEQYINNNAQLSAASGFIKDASAKVENSLISFESKFFGVSDSFKKLSNIDRETTNKFALRVSSNLQSILHKPYFIKAYDFTLPYFCQAKERFQNAYSFLDSIVTEFFLNHPQVKIVINNITSTTLEYLESFREDICALYLEVSNSKLVKDIIIKLGVFHDDRVEPLIEYLHGILSPHVSLLSKWIENDVKPVIINNEELFSMTLVIVAGVFFFRFMFTGILKLFASDVFQMNKSINDMYKTDTEFDPIVLEHSDIYKKIKKANGENLAFIHDEIEEMEELMENEKKACDNDTVLNEINLVKKTIESLKAVQHESSKDEKQGEEDEEDNENKEEGEDDVNVSNARNRARGSHEQEQEQQQEVEKAQKEEDQKKQKKLNTGRLVYLHSEVFEVSKDGVSGKGGEIELADVDSLFQSLSSNAISEVTSDYAE